MYKICILFVMFLSLVLPSSSQTRVPIPNKIIPAKGKVLLIVDGSVNPNAIPDTVAFRLVLGSLKWKTPISASAINLFTVATPQQKAIFKRLKLANTDSNIILNVVQNQQQPSGGKEAA